MTRRLQRITDSERCRSGAAARVRIEKVRNMNRKESCLENPWFGNSMKKCTALLAFFCGFEATQAEIPVDQWANPVLATADSVLGPLSDAAKLLSGIYLDYSKLTATTTIQYYKSTETSKRGTTPIQSYKTTVIETGVDPKNATRLIDRKTEYSLDPNGKLSTKVDTSPILISKLGSLQTKCEKRNPDGSLVGSYEFVVEPTQINVHVDVVKYATYAVKNPAYVYVEMSSAADLITDCGANDRSTVWTQVTRVSPGVQNIVPFVGKNLLTQTAWPRIDIGYSYAPRKK